MLASAQVQRKWLLPERMLIMRLITSMGLVLLLAAGIAAANHLETVGHSASASVAATASLDPHASVHGVPLHDSVAMDAAADGALLGGAALCLLGVLCGLVFFARTRTRRQRRPQRFVTTGSRISSPSFIAVVQPRSSALALSQMGLSRT